MTPYQVSSEIYGGFFYSGITLTYSVIILFRSNVHELRAKIISGVYSLQQTNFDELLKFSQTQ